ncbi:MAG TPA: succinate--CoA ligase subunit alpha [Stellaceae bacterium]|nr:succinate--CoA ligase subunit alpha [Stellaceae bacterium]
MDSTLFAPDVPTLVQGITGRAGRTHAQLMRRYGTRIVGGVSARGTEPIGDIPVFAACSDAVRATGARASLLMVPPLDVLAAGAEAIAAGIELLVCVTEGVPAHDALKLVRLARAQGAVCIGPSTPGIAIPGRMKIGFLPDAALAPGPIGVMSKSGTLSYEICHRLAQRGIGQSLWIGVGGDAVKGTRFADLVPLFEDRADTVAVLVIGEIGGTEEEDLAEALMRHRAQKPVFVLLAGTNAPEGVTMGHAGALIYGARGTAASKIAALRQAGAHVFATMAELVDAVPDLIAAAASSGTATR